MNNNTQIKTLTEDKQVNVYTQPTILEFNGVLTIVERVTNNASGNPRYKIAIAGLDQFKTITTQNINAKVIEMVTDFLSENGGFD